MLFLDGAYLADTALRQHTLLGTPRSPPHPANLSREWTYAEAYETW